MEEVEIEEIQEDGTKKVIKLYIIFSYPRKKWIKILNKSLNKL